MEDDDGGGSGSGSSPGTPFWVQSSSRSRPQISSFFLNSGILIFFLCLSALLAILFIIPWFLSLTSQILRPNLVKKTWDWFNAVLIILCLIFGFLSRNKNTDDDDRTVLSAQKSQSQQTSTLFQWDDRGASNASIRTPKLHDSWYESSPGYGLKRNSSSYPDLRDMTSFLDQRRFLDDTHVENSGVMLDSDQVRRRRRGRTEVDRDLGSDGSKEICIDTETTIRKEVNLTQTPQPRPFIPPSPSPIGPELRDAEQEIDPEWKQVMMGHSEKTRRRSSSQQGLPAELPEKKKSSSKSERKRSGGTATKEFINSFYHQSKKKKNQRAKSLDNFESLLGKHEHLSVPPPPPSPPPPPPRTSVFQNILSVKKRKPKKIISVPAPPPPPPPPTKTKTERKPLVPAKRIDSNKAVKTQEDSPMTMGNESPLPPIPPPPPPPPFKMPSWKFVVQGDYVRVGSFNSSISTEHESSDAEERESPTSEISNTDSIGTHTPAAAAPALFCPSPDVNTKAEMFIARFRAGLQLQKINSFEQKQRLGMSNLGPQAQSHSQSRPK